MDNKIIAALCTARGSGAIGLIRVSGKNVRQLLLHSVALSSKKNLCSVATHTICHGFLHDKDNDIIDEVLFLVMDAPRTYTGDDTIEITCHNNTFIIDAILNRLYQLGAVPAQAGEFTMRAFENKKLDLLQAEAVADLIHAQNYTALKAALSQLQGSLSHEITIIEEELCKIAAWCQANFEFLDEERDFHNQISLLLDGVENRIKKLCSQEKNHALIRNGITIACIGSVNAGKSSLFNKIIGKERSIVTNTPGTTRDTVESGLYRNGIHTTFIDTAGIRETEDVIEQEGVRRSYNAAQTADIILLIYDASRILLPYEQRIYDDIQEKYHKKIISIYNKIDLPWLIEKHSEKNSILISQNVPPAELFFAIDSKISELTGSNEMPFLLNQRHMHILSTVLQKIEEIKDALCKKIVHDELILFSIHEALTVLSETTGKTVSEKTMDTVFKEFCVGK